LLTVLTACAGNNKRTPPDWSVAELPVSVITEPTTLPLLCKVFVIEGVDGNKYATWDSACWNDLQAYEIISQANTEIAQSNADALRNTEAGYAAVVNAGKMQQELTQFYAELLEDERSGRFIDSLLYRSLIALGFIVVAL